MADAAAPRAVPATGLRSPAFKLVLIVVLTIIMAVPLLFIQLALSDRESRAADAVTDVATGWSGAQTVTGPILFVPYDITTKEVVDKKVVTTTNSYTAIILPKRLDVDAQAATETLWRGIFEVPVYRSAIRMRATFDPETVRSINFGATHIRWAEATIGVGVSDVRGLIGNVALHHDTGSVAFQPGLADAVADRGGIHAPIDLSNVNGPLDLDIALSLRGSRELSLAPLGEQTTAQIKSSWPDPSFFGTFLPTERRVDAKGFEAKWSVPYLARGFGQTFSGLDSLNRVFSTSFGVRFYQSVDFYQLVQRSLKYAVMFVGLAFLVFFIVELISGKRLHGAQYAMIGAAQVLFYLLLLSFAEHIGFGFAYLLAMGGTIVMTCLYASSVLASRLQAAILFVVLTLLYGLLYIILIQEDYALLVGSLLIFSALGITMFVTRRMDWYQIVPAPGAS
jgi:inner membrane protein